MRLHIRCLLGPAVRLDFVDALTSEVSLKNYYLLPSVSGDLLAKLGLLSEAHAEFEHAASLSLHGVPNQSELAQASEGRPSFLSGLGD